MNISNSYFPIVLLTLLLINQDANGFGNNGNWDLDKNPENWMKLGKNSINRILKKRPNGGIAKNIILFLGKK